jgi:hypothetical protein
VQDTDSLSPIAVVRAILGVAMAVTAAGVLVAWYSSGTLPWKGVALLLVLSGIRSFAGTLFDGLLAPVGRFLGGALGGGLPSEPDPTTIEDETAALERLLARDDLAQHRELLAGIRLAEIYRLQQHDPAKADALIERLRAKYPDAHELTYARLP